MTTGFSIDMSLKGGEAVVAQVDAVDKGMGKLTGSVDTVGVAMQKLSGTTSGWQQNMAGVDAAMRATAATSTELSAATQKILDRYDPLGTKLRSLQTDMALLRREMGNSSSDAAFKTFQGLEADIEKTSNLMSTAGVDGFKKMGEAADKGAFSTVGAKRELMVLGHEAMQGNFSKMPGSFMVLAERMDLTTALMSPMTLGFVAIAGAAVGVTVAVAKGASEQTAMNNALIMTGNYAGQTSDSLNELAHAAVATGGSVGDAKKVVTELAASGKFTGEQIGTITTSVIAMEHATGASVEKTIKQFETLAVESTGNSARASDAISRATIKLDDEYHFLTLAVYEQIRALELEGSQKAASKLATDELAKATKNRSEEIIGNLGNVATAWNTVKESIGRAVDAVGDWGKKSTAASEVDRLSGTVANLQSGNYGGTPGAYNEASRVALLAQATAELTIAKTELSRVNDRAATQAATALTQSEGVHAAQRVDAMLLGIQKKSQSELTIALREYHEEINKVAAANPNDPRVTAEAISAGEAAITKAKTEHVKVSNDTYAQLSQSMEKFGADAQQELDTGAKLTAADRFRIAEINLIVIAYNKKKITYEQLIGLEATMEQNALKRERADAVLKATKDIEDQAKSYDDLINSIGKAGDTTLKSLESSIAKQKEHNAEIGKTKEQIDLIKQAAEDVGTAQLEMQAAAIEGWLSEQTEASKAVGIYEEVLKQLNAQIAARKTLSGALAEGAALEASAAVAKASSAEWKKGWEETDRLGREVFADWGMNGANMAQKIGNTLKKALLSAIYEATLKPLAFQLYTSVAGGGGSGAAGALNGVNTVSGIGSSYSMLSAGFNASVGGGISSLGNLFGSNAAASFGLGVANSSAMAPAIAAYTEAATAASAAGNSALAATYTQTASGLSAGSSSASVIPVVGWIMAAMAANGSLYDQGYKWDNKYAAIDPVVAITDGLWQRLGTSGKVAAILSGSALQQYLGDKIFGSSRKEVTGSGIEGTFGPAGFAGNNFANYKQDGGWFHSDRTGKDTSPLGNGTLVGFTDSFVAIKQYTTTLATSLGLSAEAIKGYSKDITIAFTEDDAKNKQLIADAFSGMANDIAAAAAPGLSSFAKTGETASTTLQRLSTSITAANAWLSMLRNRLFDVSMAGADAASKLADAFGGLDNLAASSKAYYETYYTEAERTTRSSQDLAKAMALVNVALPTSKDAFRDVVSSLDLTTEAGRNAYAVLLALAPEYAATSDSLDRMAKERADAAIKAAQDAAKLAKDMADKLLATFTGNGLLLPALDAAALKTALLGDTLGSTYEVAGNISTLFLDVNSGLLTFGTYSQTLAGGLTGAQLAALSLNDQIDALHLGADQTRIDFAGLSTALATVDTETFTNTIAMVFENLATRITGVLDSIGTERIAVREAALSIMNPTVMGKAQIQSGIASINTALPSNAAVIAANTAVAQIDQANIDRWVRYLNVAVQYGMADAEANIRPITEGMLAAQSAANAAVKTSLTDYAAAMQNFAIDAGKSIGKLSRLREETVKYYEAQKQLADLMGSSAAGLRTTVADYRYSQLSDAQQFDKLQADFAKNYAMGLSTDGETLAGYGDKLNASLTPLLEKAREVLSGSAYDSFAATALARAETIAGRLETLTPTNYAADSLMMLGNIDATLAALDASSQSAEKIISDAVNAGSDKTAAGLRAIVQQLGGSPAFAGGGDHAGGGRWVGENGPEYEVTGPSHIYNAQQLRRLGAGSGGNAEVVAELRALRQDNASMRIELRALVSSNARLARLAERAEIDGQLVRTDADTPLTTVVVV